VAYEEFLDAGLEFTDQEVASWNPLAWAKERQVYLRGLHQQLSALRNVSGELKWIEKTQGVIKICHAQYVRLTLEDVAREDELEAWYPPDKATSAGKKFLTSLTYDLDAWAAEWVHDAEMARSYVATIGDRAKQMVLVAAKAKTQGVAPSEARDIMQKAKVEARGLRSQNNRVVNVIHGQEMFYATARLEAIQGIKDRVENRG